MRNIEHSLPGLKYMPGSTQIHNIHPLAKLISLILFSVTVFMITDPAGGIMLLIMLFVAYHFAGLGLAFFLRKLKVILIFGTVIILVQVLFCQQGTMLWKINIFGMQIAVWSEGITRGTGLALRFVNVIAASYLFITTTDPNKLAYALMQAGLPYRQGFMLVTALRFIPIFHTELSQIRCAQMAKGIDLRGKSLKSIVLFTRYLFVPLVISALSKVDDLSISMEGRAFGLYKTRTYMNSYNFTKKDWLYIVVSFLLLTYVHLFFN